MRALLASSHSVTIVLGIIVVVVWIVLPQTSVESTSVVRVFNVGTTALYYSWHRVDRGGTSAIGTPHLRALPFPMNMRYHHCMLPSRASGS